MNRPLLRFLAASSRDLAAAASRSELRLVSTGASSPESVGSLVIGAGSGPGRLLGAALDRDLAHDLLGFLELLGVLLPLGVGGEVAQVLVGLDAVARVPGRDATLNAKPCLPGTR